MPGYKYLIVGSGMTAASALQGIRDLDPSGPVAMFGLEKDPPYNRPPLSKGLWKGEPLESVWRPIQDSSLAFHPGRAITRILPGEKRVEDDQGGAHSYERLMLATGGEPRRLPFGGGEIIYFRTLQDYRRLEELSRRCNRFAVIGGGFIGSELAAALAMKNKRVSMIFPDEGLGAKVYPRDLSHFLNDFYRKKGVEVLAGENAVGVEGGPGRFVVHLGSGRSVTSEVVVAGIGIRPSTELARAAGLPTGDGIAVDEYLRAGDADIYAAGDAAEFYNPALGKRIRVEHEDAANTMGRHAGRNMAGAGEPCRHLPFFYSDLFELGYEAVGELDSRAQAVAQWEEPYRKGVVYYLSDKRVRGVLLWNVWEQVDAARKLIAEPGPHTAESVKGRIPA